MNVKKTLLVFVLILVLLVPGVAQDSSGQKQAIKTLIEILESHGIKAMADKYAEFETSEAYKQELVPDAFLKPARTLYDQGNYKLLIDLYTFLREKFPGNEKIPQGLIACYIEDDELEKATELNDELLEKSPDSISHIFRGEQLYTMQHYVKKEYMVPMRDGVRLFTQVYSPIDTSKNYPVLMNRTPYSVAPYGEEKSSYAFYLAPSLDMLRDGYIFVKQDVRGRFYSEGQFVDMRPILDEYTDKNAIDEATDTYDTIEWVLKNVANNSGKVGIYGTSYPGFYAVTALLANHPALVASMPCAPISDWFVGDDFHRNGAFSLIAAVDFFKYFSRAWDPEVKSYGESLLQYPQPNLYEFFLNLGTLSTVNEKYFNNRSAMWNDLMEHGTYDEFWQKRNILPQLKKINTDTAVLVVGGWYDAEDLYGPLKIYRELNSKCSNLDVKIVMGPWHHGMWGFPGRNVLVDVDVQAGEATKVFMADMVEPFFRKQLKGEEHPELSEASMFEVGTNKWKYYESWPVTDSKDTALYLQEDGQLSFNEPSITNSTYDEFVSDPAKPVPHIGGIITSWNTDFMIADQRYAAVRPDVLVYQTDVLEEDVTVVGPILARLFVSTTGTDADWVVKVIDVYPQDAIAPEGATEGIIMGGYQKLVRALIMRGKFRNSYSKPEPFEPGKVTSVEMELQDVNYSFKKGHRIMVQIQSSWFPVFDRNPQQFVDIYSAVAEDFIKATHRVFRSEEYPSHLEISVAK